LPFIKIFCIVEKLKDLASGQADTDFQFHSRPRQ